MAKNTTSHRTRRLLGLLVAGAAALAACGNDDPSPPAAAGSDVPTGDHDSEYCDVARQWLVHELTPVDESDPETLRAYIGEYVDFLDDGVRTAPDDIAAEWKLSAESFQTMVLPVLEKYDYDVARIQAEATPEEQAVSEPPPDVAAAQETIHVFEAFVCGAGQPPAADEQFEGPGVQAYCEPSMALEGLFFESVNAEDPPAALRAVVTGDEFEELMAAMDDNAPEEIRTDVIAVNEFTREKGVPVLEKYDHDVRRLLLEGSASDHAIFQYTDAAIRDEFSRVLAYEDQLCSGES